MSYLLLRNQWQWCLIFAVSLFMLFAAVISEYRFWTLPDNFALPAVTTTAAYHAQNTEAAVNDVLHWHLFGDIAIQDDNLAAALQVKLIGVFMSPNPKLRSVIMQDNAGMEFLIHIDETLPNQWKVLEIEKNEVVLIHAGRRVRIGFAKLSPQDQSNPPESMIPLQFDPKALRHRKDR